MAGRAAKPKQIKKPDFAPLIEACQDYIDAVYEEKREEEIDADLVQGIFEEALKCVFGSDVFDFID